MLSLFVNVVSESKFVSLWLILQAMMSMFQDLGFVSRHHIIPDRLARYVSMFYYATVLVSAVWNMLLLLVCLQPFVYQNLSC